jgi:hypothetical protein
MFRLIVALYSDIFPNGNDWLIFLIETEFVLCAVQTKLLCRIYMNVSLYSSVDALEKSDHFLSWTNVTACTAR